MKLTRIFVLSALLAVTFLAGCYAPVLCHCAHCKAAKAATDPKPALDQKLAPQ